MGARERLFLEATVNTGEAVWQGDNPIRRCDRIGRNADTITYVEHPEESRLQPHEVSYAQDHVEYALRQVENATLALGALQTELVSVAGRREFENKLATLAGTVAEAQRALSARGQSASGFPDAHWYRAADMRQGQSWNPLRVWKNSRNLWDTWANGGNPAALLRMMRDALTRLSHDAQKQNAWTFTGLDTAHRPTILALIGAALQTFSAYADWFNTQPQPAIASSASGNARTASLTDGIDRDITDVLGLLGPLSDEDRFAGGKAVYDKIVGYLTVAQGVLEGNITPEQAGKQVGIIAPVAAPASGNPVPQTTPVQDLGTSAGPLAGQSAGNSSAAYPSSGPYTSPGETYNSTQYLRQERVPGTAEWQNEVQNYLGWGLRNGTWVALNAKLRKDQHTPDFVNAVQQAWQARGLEAGAGRDEVSPSPKVID